MVDQKDIVAERSDREKCAREWAAEGRERVWQGRALREQRNWPLEIKKLCVCLNIVIITKASPYKKKVSLFILIAAVAAIICSSDFTSHHQSDYHHQIIQFFTERHNLRKLWPMFLVIDKNLVILHTPIGYLISYAVRSTSLLNKSLCGLWMFCLVFNLQLQLWMNECILISANHNK